MKYVEYCAARAQKAVLQIYNVNTGKIEIMKKFNYAVEAPSWSKDGKKLLYSSYGNVYWFDLETKESFKVDTGIADTCNNDCVLKPDGSALGVSSGRNGDMNSRIYTVDFVSGEVKEITSLPLSYLHGWSPDGTMLAFCAGREVSGDGDVEWDIYTIPAEGGEEVRLTNAPGLNDGPEYSSDGKHIWFNSVRTGLMQVWRMDSDGKNQMQMTFAEDMNSWFPHISPDGTKVVYVAYHKGDLEPGQHLPDLNVEIRLIPAVGGEEKTLVKLFGGQGTMNVNSWSPDSTRFAFVSYEK